MASQLEAELCCINHCWDVYEQNNIVNSVGVDDRTTEWVAASSEPMRIVNAPWKATKYQTKINIKDWTGYPDLIFVLLPKQTWFFLKLLFEFSPNVEFTDKKILYFTKIIRICHHLCKRPRWYHSTSKTQVTEGILLPWFIRFRNSRNPLNFWSIQGKLDCACSFPYRGGTFPCHHYNYSATFRLFFVNVV